MSIFKNRNETAFVDGKKHWTDVIKNTAPEEVLLWRQPEEDFNTNSTLIVMPGEVAIFIKGGQIQQIFSNGTYKLSTENYPFISRLRNAFSGGVSTFNCVVYYVRTAHSAELKWGTDSPLQVRDNVLGMATTVRARGVYKIKVENPELFLERLVGNNVQLYTQNEIDNFFALQFQSKIKTILTQKLVSLQTELLGVEARLDELSVEIKPQIDDLVGDYGLKCIQFVISAMDIDDSDLRKRYDEINMNAAERIRMAQAEKAAMPLEAEGERAAMEALGEKWAPLQASKILGDLANNPGAGGTASAMSGIGVGVAAGSVFGNMANQMFSSMNHNEDAVKDEKQMSETYSFPTNGSGRFVQKSEKDSEPESNTEQRDDPVMVLKQLKEMLDIGVITKEEYEKKKQEVLSRM